jgi:uncharacterized repeat protein (TIGR03837 family)
MRWDIFCKVIDNYGDIGVCLRLAADLGARGEQVRLWVDDASVLAWMAPQGAPGVAVLDWNDARVAEPGDAVIEAFACEPDDAFKAAIARRGAASALPAWINLEYLSAEGWVERCHALPSPVLSGPATGCTKHFFHPGFTRATGGLLRERGLMDAQAAFDRSAWLRERGIPFAGERLVSLFCYEPPGLRALLEQLASSPQATRLLVTHGRPAAAVRALLAGGLDLRALAIDWLKPMPQPGYDRLLWSCDFNFVRGEDSLVRALWAGRPFAWQIYPQDGDAHLVKLDAFLDWLRAPPSLRQLHAAWNTGMQPMPSLADNSWQPVVQQARSDLLAQDDLTTQLLRFVQGH